MLYHTGRTSHDKFWPDFKNTLIKFTFSDQPITIALLHFKDPLIHAQCISKYKKFWKRKDTPFPQKTAGFYDHVYMGKCYDMWQGFLNFCFVFFFFDLKYPRSWWSWVHQEPAASCRSKGRFAANGEQVTCVTYTEQPGIQRRIGAGSWGTVAQRAIPGQSHSLTTDHRPITTPLQGRPRKFS